MSLELRTLRNRAVACAALAGAVAISGCATSGLSPRENPQVGYGGYSDYALATYSDPNDGTHARSSVATESREVTLPARLAVAQFGEVAPPEVMVQSLSEREDLFASVQTISGLQPNTGQSSNPYERATLHLDAMRRYARDIGADYLFFYGGTVDHATKGTALSAADLTIIGAFVVPSKRTEALMKASGTLIDVNTGRALMSVSADKFDKKMSAAIQAEAAEARLLMKMRDEVSVELARSLNTEFENRADTTAQGG